MVRSVWRRRGVPGHLLQNLIFGTRALVVDGDMVEGTRLAPVPGNRWLRTDAPPKPAASLVGCY